jgi:hypothetical protein
MRKKLFFIAAIGAMQLMIILSAHGQGRERVLQFSGVVVGTDSVSGVPGVHIYVPKAGRGATTNVYGYFSMPVLVGDSVVISAVGYKKQHYIIPGDKGENLTAIIELSEDVTYLPEVEVYPFPTEEMFKQAILALEIPQKDQYENMRRNLNEEVLAKMFQAMPMDGSMNHKWFLEQQNINQGYKFMPPTNPLLNPFAWAEFIKSLKRGDFKSK